MLQKMEAVLFLSPNDLTECTCTLIERDFDVEVLDDWIDDCGPTIFVRAITITELTEERFCDYAADIVAPFDGEVVEAGLFHPQQAASLATCGRRL
jgi:hypothetical protein